MVLIIRNQNLISTIYDIFTNLYFWIYNIKINVFLIFGKKIIR